MEKVVNLKYSQGISVLESHLSNAVMVQLAEKGLTEEYKITQKPTTTLSIMNILGVPNQHTKSPHARFMV